MPRRDRKGLGEGGLKARSHQLVPVSSVQGTVVDSLSDGGVEDLLPEAAPAHLVLAEDPGFVGMNLPVGLQLLDI